MSTILSRFAGRSKEGAEVATNGASWRNYLSPFEQNALKQDEKDLQTARVSTAVLTTLAAGAAFLMGGPVAWVAGGTFVISGLANRFAHAVQNGTSPFADAVDTEMNGRKAKFKAENGRDMTKLETAGTLAKTTIRRAISPTSTGA